MAWDSTAASGVVLDQDEWNTMVAYIKDDVADLSTHISDTTVHTTAAEEAKWNAAYLHSANASLHAFNPVNYITSSNSIARFKSSSGRWHYASSQLLSGQLLAIHSARDINSWNSSSWHNSGLMWDNYLQKWKPHKSGASTGAPGATAFTDLTDVPNSYAGKTGKLPIVNSTADGLIFAEIVCNNNEIIFNNNSVVWA